MPNSEMMKSTQRYGWKFSCGWLPPVDEIACTAIDADGGAFRYGKNVDACATTLLAGFASVAALVEPRNAWLCAGICSVVNVTVSTPLVSANVMPFPVC